jgi:hypothetical protein
MDFAFIMGIGPYNGSLYQEAGGVRSVEPYKGAGRELIRSRL